MSNQSMRGNQYVEENIQPLFIARHNAFMLLPRHVRLQMPSMLERHKIHLSK